MRWASRKSASLEIGLGKIGPSGPLEVGPPEISSPEGAVCVIDVRGLLPAVNVDIAGNQVALAT